VDPDGVIEQRNLGRVASDTTTLVSAIRTLHGDPAAYAASSRAAREYFRAHHAMDAVMPLFEDVFASLAQPMSQALRTLLPGTR
jgi:hypothetical protein